MKSNTLGRLIDARTEGRGGKYFLQVITLMHVVPVETRDSTAAPRDAPGSSVCCFSFLSLRLFAGQVRRSCRAGASLKTRAGIVDSANEARALNPDVPHSEAAQRRPVRESPDAIGTLNIFHESLGSYRLD